MSQAADRNRQDAPTSKKLEELYSLIEGIEIAMFTTRRPDGYLVSRPMATQTQAEGTDLWFVTDIESHKLDELEFDPNVNLAYYRDGTREWASVSGPRHHHPGPARHPRALPQGLESLVRR
jgi:general stress protein 26